MVGTPVPYKLKGLEFKENTELDCGGKEFIRRVINARDKQHHGCLSEESSILQTESGSLLQLLKPGFHSLKPSAGKGEGTGCVTTVVTLLFQARNLDTWKSVS